MKIIVIKMENGRILVRDLASKDFRVLPLDSAMDYIKELLEGDLEPETDE